MADPSPTATSINPYDYLKIVPNPDGFLTRHHPSSDVPATGDVSVSLQSVPTKDVTINPANKTWVRIFRPREATPDSNLPLLIFFHGGGFILFTSATQQFHESCAHMASEFPAVIVSVSYRLSPEHRLPVAYEDAVDAILWVKNQALDESNGDRWLRDYVDFSMCFLMGSSSGGNIIYHAGLRALGLDLGPVNISGLIFIEPYFGGVQRTQSEMRLNEDRIIPLPVNDLMWELALPSDADRDHEYSNPMGSHPQKLKEGMIGSLPKCLVTGYGGDPLIDRQKEFVKMLDGFGVDVVTRFEEGGYHAIDLFEPARAQALSVVIKSFIHSFATRN
ncbi:PREDICTED: probable carboxylesterase 8 [Nelumbo nucifera]|uniref:Alpha/beta hydrolase fold-3 domain-containing protein n=2 Tax=Nelumbo nucifera TaxID=4432 RepID=A0A822XEF9_NELNU|nr:PREDICTED: probable carboxylesterase 8 [Nelumbo nucifera]XP_019053080.1 PREDICTED: probable carboxylesterase 8 [Nelumbo nucifera]DAD18710.1 TPA_asm: hypothetical protein HUJ06_020173 [Nelumbo nucifera]